jgi:hypothetical protein
MQVQQFEVDSSSAASASSCHPEASQPQPFMDDLVRPSATKRMQQSSETSMQVQQLNAEYLGSQPGVLQPWPVVDHIMKPHFRKRLMEVFDIAKLAMQSSQCVAEVDMTECEGTLCFVLRPRVSHNSTCQIDEIIELAKNALWEAAEPSNCIYLLGYTVPKAFTPQPQGFSVNFGVMENANNTCWHIFKKGFCRHGANCSKKHPACQVLVRVLVESTQLNPCTSIAETFQQEMVDLSMAVMAALQKCGYAEKVEGLKDQGSQGWTIEVMPKEELQQHKKYLSDLAKKVLLGTAARLSLACIMGYEAEPFISKTQGFVAMVGSMCNKSTACWSFYSKGACTRCPCRFDHPDCMMPINIVIKDRPSLTVSPAMLQNLAHRHFSLLCSTNHATEMSRRSAMHESPSRRRAMAAWPRIMQSCPDSGSSMNRS